MLHATLLHKINTHNVINDLLNQTLIDEIHFSQATSCTEENV